MEHDEKLSSTDQTVAPVQETRRKRKLLIAAGVAGALVLGGAVATPAIAANLRTQQYADITSEISTIHEQISEANADLAAATALTAVQFEEASEQLDQLAKLADTDAPILTKKQTKALSNAAKEAVKALGDKPERTDARTEAAATLKAAVKAARESDSKATADAKKSGKNAPAATVPTTYLELDLADARKLAFPASEPTQVKPVEKVTTAVLEDAKHTLDAAKAELADITAAVDAETALQDGIAAGLAGTLPALIAAAEGAPAQAKQVLAAANKAGSTKSKVTKTAKQAKKAAAVEDPAPGAVQGALTAYVKAAKTAQQTHRDQVAAEEAAAAAAAEQAQQWTAPTPDTSWTPPADNSGGGGNGGGGGGGNGGGGGGDGGWTPPPPPPGGGGCPEGMNCYV